MRPLTLHLGRAGSGKSTALLRAIAHEAAQPHPATCYLLVPEPFSHETERLLCAEAGDRAASCAEVITFKRLSARLLRAGLPLPPAIDDGGRQLVMKAAFDMVRDQLKSNLKSAHSIGFLPSLLQTIDELQRGTVTPAQLLEASVQSDEPSMRHKLYDLSLLLAAFDAAGTQTGYHCGEPLMDIARLLPESGMADDVRLFVDGFVTFTAAEVEVLRVFVERARDVSVALCCDAADTRLDHFKTTARTALQLTQMAETAGRTVETVRHSENHRAKASRLRALEQTPFAAADDEPPADDGSIAVFATGTVWQACEVAAATVAKLVRNGARYRDIAVVARHIDGFLAPLCATFARFDIPVFADRTVDILQKPILSVLLTALSALRSGYAYDSLFAYLRTGLAGLSADECDTLENYVLQWQPRNWRADWRSHPDGYGKAWRDADHERLDAVNALRVRAIAPLEQLRVATQSGRPAAQLALALYDFMERLDLAGQLERRAARLVELGQPQLAIETQQLWDIACQALLQCHSVLNDSPLTLEQFAELFKLVLSQYSVGSIPASLDSVSVGSTDRLRKRRLKHLILLGADDELLTPPEPGGLLSDSDRIFLEGLGHNLSLPLDQRLDRELFTFYSAVTLPSDSLTLCIPDPTGQRQENHFVAGWRARFGLEPLPLDALQPYLLGGSLNSCRAAAARADDAGRLAVAALRRLGGQDDYLNALQRTAAFRRQSLSPQTAGALYRDRPLLSATRVDLWQKCRFQYFLRYGLRATPRPEAGLRQLDTGNFLHSVIEQVTVHIMAHGGFTQTTDTAVMQLTNRLANQVLDGYLPADEKRSRRLQVIVNRLVYMAEQVMTNIAQELNGSKFQPLDAELAFGSADGLPALPVADGSLLLQGKIDRVDGYVKDGTLYLRVVDYKSGRSGFSLSHLYKGLSLQLFLYTLGLDKLAKERYAQHFGVDKVQPAGLLYVPARQVFAAEGTRPDDSLRRSGLLLDDRELLEAMEPQPGERFLPPKEKDSYVLTTLENWGRLAGHVDKLMGELGAAMRSGALEAQPACIQGTLTCRYCQFKLSCQFDPRSDSDRPRYFRTYDKSEVFDLLAEEVSQP